MDWFILLLVYALLVSILTFEGYRRAIGGTAAFLISLLLTPLIGFFAVWFSKKRIVFRHFVKLNNNNIKEDAIKKTLHRSGKDHWDEIKTSELRIL